MVPFTLTILPNCVLVPIAVASIVSTFLLSAERARVTAVSRSAASNNPPNPYLRIFDLPGLLCVIVFLPRSMPAGQFCGQIHSTLAPSLENVIHPEKCPCVKHYFCRC